MPRTRRSILLALLIIVGGLAAPALNTAASTPAEPQFLPGIQTVIYAAYTDAPAAKVPPPDVFLERLKGVGAQTATINVNYIGTWNPDAQTAFQFAVDIWETLITSLVPIAVDATWTSSGFPPGALGGAGPENFVANFLNAPTINTWYPVAIANKLAGTDLDPGFSDISARFNSGFSSWYFGTAGQPLSTQYDFVSVVLHEIGHGLGFTGSMRVGGASYCSSGLGCWGGNTPYPFIYDRFTVNGSGQYLISDFPNYSTALAAQLTSNNIFFSGANAAKANGNTNVKLYAPGAWSQGSSYVHLDNVFDGTPNALMTFSITNGESIHNPGSVMLCMFKDMGWTVTVSGASAASASAMSAPGFTAFGLDNVTVMVTETVYLPLIMKGGIC